MGCIIMTCTSSGVHNYDLLVTSVMWCMIMTCMSSGCIIMTCLSSVVGCMIMAGMSSGVHEEKLHAKWYA